MKPNHLSYLTRLLALLWLGHSTLAWAETNGADDFSYIQLVETEDSDCALKDGSMMSLSNSQQGVSVEVWVDRWFMDVQTADHTKHTFNHHNELIPLGCTNTVSGKQHWTIHSVKKLPN
jgi:hypothetical protein